MAFYNSMQNTYGFNNLFLDTVPVTLGDSYGDYLGMNASLTGTEWFPAVGTTGATGPAFFNSLTVNGPLTVTGGSTFDGQVKINNTTQSTSTTTGALVVAGGVGIGKNLWVGGTGGINMINDNLAAGGLKLFNTTTGSAVTDGTSLYMDGAIMYLDNRETVSSAIRLNLAGAIREQITSLETAGFSPTGATRTSIQDAGITDEVASITREILDNTSSRIYSPNGSSGIFTVADSSITLNTDGVNRVSISNGNSAILSPDGLNDILIGNSVIRADEGGQTRLLINSSVSSLLSPDGSTGRVEVDNATVTIRPTITLNGSTSGSTILQASAVASGTLTLPAITDTLVTKTSTDTLTNKSFTNSKNSDLTNFNQVQFHNASTFPAFSGGSALNNTLIASKHTSGTTITGGRNLLLGSMDSVLSSGSDNIIIGNTTTGDAITSGSSNTIIGTNAGSGITTHSNNILIGDSAGAGINGDTNIAIGIFSMSGTNNNTSVAQNVCLGYRTGDNLTTAGNNTLLGYSAGINLTTSTANTFIGHNSGTVGTSTNTNCTLIGKDSNFTSATGFSNSSALGYQATITASNQITLGNGSVTSVVPTTTAVTSLGTPSLKFNADLNYLNVGSTATFTGMVDISTATYVKHSVVVTGADPYVVTATDEYIVYNGPTTGHITLPNVATNVGRTLHITSTDTTIQTNNNSIIATNGSVIRGSANVGGVTNVIYNENDGGAGPSASMINSFSPDTVSFNPDNVSFNPDNVSYNQDTASLITNTPVLAPSDYSDRNVSYINAYSPASLSGGNPSLTGGNPSISYTSRSPTVTLISDGTLWNKF